MSYIRTNFKLPLQNLSDRLLEMDWLIRQLDLIPDINNLISANYYQLSKNHTRSLMTVTVAITPPIGKFMTVVTAIHLLTPHHHPDIYVYWYEDGDIFIQGENIIVLENYIDDLKQQLNIM